MNARLLSNAAWSCQAQQMCTYEDSDQSAYTKKKKPSALIIKLPAKEVKVKDGYK